MPTNGESMQPARQSGRRLSEGAFETTSFAHRTAKRRQKNKLAKAALRKNRR